MERNKKFLSSINNYLCILNLYYKSNMKKIIFNCETITPMFISGADGVTPELRPPSIKGALRFWWRAMNGGDWKTLKPQEDEIFGSTEKRSKLLISILPPFPKFSKNGENLPQITKIKTYYKEGRIKKKKDGTEFKMETYSISMLDYLTIGLKDDYTLNRGFIKPDEKFTVQLRVPEEYFDTVRNSFIALSQFGGLGAKSHNGFGCFRVETLKVNNVEVDIPMLDFVELAQGERQAYTKFSKDTMLVRTVTTQANTWESTLGELGRIYQKSRETVENNGIEGWHTYKKRELLSAPIIVGKGRDAQKSFLDRHAKPYFLHISKIKDGNNWKFEGYIYCFPYLFLKDSEHYSDIHLENYNQAIIDFNTKLKTL